MSYDLLMQQRLERILQVLLVLPELRAIPAELLVLSAGEGASAWSFRHIAMTGVTYHFIFRKAGFSEGAEPHWECVDRELNEVMTQELKRCA